MTASLTEDEVIDIVLMTLDGFSQLEIAEAVNRSREAVYKVQQELRLPNNSKGGKVKKGIKGFIS